MWTRLTYATILALLLAAGARGARAGPAQAAEELAICIGRLSALMEFQWLTEDREAEATELRRAWLVALFEGTLPDAKAEGHSGSEFLAERVRAKRGQARMLETGAFNDDPRRARLARSQARQLLTPCEAMLTR